MAELFDSYKGGAFSSVLPSMLNAAMQRRNRVAQYNIPRERPVQSSGSVAYSSNRQAQREPFAYMKWQDETLGETIAGINNLRDLSKTETETRQVETHPAGVLKGTVEVDEYEKLLQIQNDSKSLITDLESASKDTEKKILNFPKGDLTPIQEAQRDQLKKQFNQLQENKSQTEGALFRSEELITDNIARGGGPMVTGEVTEQVQVPATNAEKREAAMKMVTNQTGLGGKEMAALYAEIDKLYPEPKVAMEHRTPDGKTLGWTPYGTKQVIQKIPGFDAQALNLDQWELGTASVDQYGQVKYNYKPKETPNRVVNFPGMPKMYAVSDQSAAAMNEHLTNMPSMMRAIDRLLNIAEQSQFEESIFNKLDPKIRAEAEQLQIMLIGKIRVALVGPGVVSNFDYEQLQKAAENPTEIFNMKSLLTGGKSAVIKMQTLKDQMSHALIDKAVAAGFTIPREDGGRYRLPVDYRKFDSVEQAETLGFGHGDVVFVKGLPGFENTYKRIKLKKPQQAQGGR